MTAHPRLAEGELLELNGTPVRWGGEVEVFGCRVQPGQLVVADQHGFLAVPSEDEAKLLAAVRTMDRIERHTKIAAARSAIDRDPTKLLDRIDAATRAFKEQAIANFSRPGES